MQKQAFLILSIIGLCNYCNTQELLLVATGFRFDQETFEAYYLSDVEIVSLRSGAECQKPPSFPLELYGAVGTFVFDRYCLNVELTACQFLRVFICGGKLRNDTYSDKCFSYGGGNEKEWRREEITLIEGRK